MEQYTKVRQSGFSAKKITQHNLLPATTQTFSTTWSDQFTGWKQPGWRDRIRKVLDATTPFQGFEYQYSYSPALILVEGYNSTQIHPSNYRFGMLSGMAFNINPLADPSLIPITTARNLAIGKLYSRINSIQGRVQTGETIGELRTTLNMMRRPLSSFRKVLNDVFTGYQRVIRKSKRLKDFTKAAADMYLEFQFGWNPLADTVVDAVNALKDRHSWWDFVDFGASAKHDVSGSNVDSHIIIGILDYWHNTKSVSTAEVRYQGVYANGTNGNPDAIDNLLGLKFGDVFSTAWNLIPYSFIVDYFSNIGVIEQSFGICWSGVRWCCGTERRYVIEEQTLHKLGDPFKDLGLKVVLQNSMSPGSFTAIRKLVSRGSITSIPVPTLQFTIEGMTGRRWLNLAALATSNFGSVLGLIKSKFL